MLQQVSQHVTATLRRTVGVWSEAFTPDVKFSTKPLVFYTGNVTTLASYLTKVRFSSLKSSWSVCVGVLLSRCALLVLMLG